jgi:acyl-coenzyme A synthetase/AMP-(fatty) acid ligase/aryl carrier-like protein
MDAVPASVKTVNLAGEALAESLVEQIYANTNCENVYNLYGPTETTTYSTFTLAQRGSPVTIGRPIAGTQCYILDAHGQLVPIGVPGELFIAGVGLARGYFGRPELTNERFVRNPFNDDRETRMYRTGDLCRWLPDGNLQYLGRTDHQVKLRGFRIELGEIEAGLARHPAVREVAVIAREDTPGDKCLVAYLVAENPPDDLAEQLRTLVRSTMPEFMLPAQFVVLDEMPRTPNGKLDRKALPAPTAEDAAPRSVAVAPRTPTEELVATAFRGVLGRNNFGVIDNFFDLGGHSLMAARLVSTLRAASGADVSLRDLFTRPTIAGLAETIDAFQWLQTSKTQVGRAAMREEVML